MRPRIQLPVPLLLAAALLAGAAPPAPPPAPAALPSTLRGVPEARAEVGRVIAALGGAKGLQARRSLWLEYEMSVGAAPAAMTVLSRIWIMGDKQRIEQSFGQKPGKPNVVIFDGERLFLLAGGERRDPGDILTRAFAAEKKRLDLWWHCLHRPMSVEILGTRTIRERPLRMLRFTDADGDTTVTGIDPATYLPVSIEYLTPHPMTGEQVRSTEWRDAYTTFEETGDLSFPLTVELSLDDTKTATGTLKAARILADAPESLFGGKKARPID